MLEIALRYFQYVVSFRKIESGWQLNLSKYSEDLFALSH